MVCLWRCIWWIQLLAGYTVKLTRAATHRACGDEQEEEGVHHTPRHLHGRRRTRPLSTGIWDFRGYVAGVQRGYIYLYPLSSPPTVNGPGIAHTPPIVCPTRARPTCKSAGTANVRRAPRGPLASPARRPRRSRRRRPPRRARARAQAARVAASAGSRARASC